MSPPALGVRRIDLAVAAALAAIQIGGSLLAQRGQPERADLDPLGIVLLALGPLALTVWRRHPAVALWGVIAVTLAYLIAEYPFGPFMLSVVAALIVAVAGGHRIAAWLAAATLYGGHFAAIAAFDLDPGVSWQALAGVASWLALVLAVGEVVRGAHERHRQAERARAAEAERRVGEERIRIARELHDVLAHSLSLINVQASSALHLIDERPEGARTALSVIKEASRDALRDVRATLGVLRAEGEDAPRAPAPGVADLDALVASARGAGLRVELEVAGERRPLPAGVEGAAYRIVQEALTNVRRHARAGWARVGLIYGEDDLVIEVDDDGHGAALDDGSAGNGIAGMRERAAALGGELVVGAGAQGGFRVRARLPLDGRP